jgi:hypothetical protein
MGVCSYHSVNIQSKLKGKDIDIPSTPSTISPSSSHILHTDAREAEKLEF